ncbi:MAG: hypothetical protein ABEJ88_09475 [Halobacterium sp.]
MNRSQFVTRSLAAFGLVLASFVILGFGRLALPYRTARLLAAPTLFAAAALAAQAFGYGVLVTLGRREFE